MDIIVDTSISEKCTEEVNKFYRENDKEPIKIKMSFEQYRDLWIYTYYNWTRNVGKPHVLTKYLGCEIEIGISNEIKCS